MVQVSRLCVVLWKQILWVCRLVYFMCRWLVRKLLMVEVVIWVNSSQLVVEQLMVLVEMFLLDYGEIDEKLRLKFSIIRMKDKVVVVKVLVKMVFYEMLELLLLMVLMLVGGRGWMVEVVMSFFVIFDGLIFVIGVGLGGIVMKRLQVCVGVCVIGGVWQVVQESREVGSWCIGKCVEFCIKFCVEFIIGISMEKCMEKCIERVVE